MTAGGSRQVEVEGPVPAAAPFAGLDDDAVRAVTSLGERGLTIATAESLTGGMVCAALTAVPGASVSVRGGVVVYATDLKATLADVAADIVQRHGPVSAEVASAMAEGVRRRLGADLGLATTGVAGPDPQDGRPPGTVHVALSGPAGVRVRSCVGDARLAGDRTAVRHGTVAIALSMIIDVAAGAFSGS